MEITSREAKNAYMRNYFKNNPKVVVDTARYYSILL